MPISIDELKKDFLEAQANVVIGQLLQKLPKDRAKRAWVYVVVPDGKGRYYALLWCEVEEIAQAMGDVRPSLPFKSLESLPPSVEGVEQRTVSKQAARDLQNAQPGKRLVLLSDGKVIGLLDDISGPPRWSAKIRLRPRPARCLLMHLRLSLREVPPRVGCPKWRRRRSHAARQSRDQRLGQTMSMARKWPGSRSRWAAPTT